MAALTLFKIRELPNNEVRYAEIGEVEFTERQLKKLDLEGFIIVPIPQKVRPIRAVDFNDRPHSLVADDIKYNKYQAVYMMQNYKKVLEGCFLVEEKN